MGHATDTNDTASPSTEDGGRAHSTSSTPEEDNDALPFSNAPAIVRLRDLRAAGQEPVFVQRDQPLQTATTLMLRHGFSQLPVMPNEREIFGYISWRTIGEAVALGNTPAIIEDCTERAVRVLSPTIALTDAVDDIMNENFVMVRMKDGRIRGPVTTSDIAEQYHALSGPFLLISQIEFSLRRLLDEHATLKELRAAKYGNDRRTIESAEDLSFGEYIHVLNNDAVWKRIDIRLDRDEIIDTLHTVRKARNDIVHFQPDGLDPTIVRLLRNTSNMLQKVVRARVAPKA